MKPLPFALAALLIVGGCGGAGAPRLSARAEFGQSVALGSCARCHAVGSEGPSPNSRATPFRQIAQIYDARTLASEFDAIGRLGHYEMPPTPIGATDRAALAAYIDWFRRSAR